MKKNLLEIAIGVGVIALIVFAFWVSNKAETAITERDIINQELQLSEQRVASYQHQIDSLEKVITAARSRQKESVARQQQNIVKFNEEKDKFHRLDDGGHVIFWKNEFSRKDTVPM